MDSLDIAGIKERLNRNEEEHRLLLALKDSFEALCRFDGTEQLIMEIDVPISNGAIGTMSFAKGVLAVLQHASGEPLQNAIIWKRMQALGIKSNSKRPESLIPLHARKHPDKIKDLGNKTFQWIGD